LHKKAVKPLIVLLAVFGLSVITFKIIRGDYAFALAGRVAMSAMLLFSAIGHFAFTRGMSLMIPGFIPFKTGIVYLTGVIEILFAAGLLLPAYRVFTAWSLIVFLVLVLPANIYAAIKRVNYQKATFTGSGLSYLWFRVPLQILFIAWTYLSCIRS
jgi:uncharacterized membrane protein